MSASEELLERVQLGYVLLGYYAPSLAPTSPPSVGGLMRMAYSRRSKEHISKEHMHIAHMSYISKPTQKTKLRALQPGTNITLSNLVLTSRSNAPTTQSVLPTFPPLFMFFFFT